MKYFTIMELIASGEAKKKKIDNTPPPDIKIKLSALINNLLDPIREKWGHPIMVNSGYRCPMLNKAVGGVATSQHTKGEAADITTGNKNSNKKLFNMIVLGGYDFDQLISENDYQWIHISYKAKNRRRQILYK